MRPFEQQTKVLYFEGDAKFTGEHKIERNAELCEAYYIDAKVISFFSPGYLRIDYAETTWFGASSSYFLVKQCEDNENLFDLWELLTELEILQCKSKIENYETN